MTTGNAETRKALRARWDATWRALGVAPQPSTTFDDLVAAYSETHRFYHTLAHLEECFAHFDSVKQLARHSAEIEIAIWFHDAIYDTQRNDNEEKSTAWAANGMRSSRLPAKVAARIENLNFGEQTQSDTE